MKLMRSTVLASPLVLALACTHAQADRTAAATPTTQDEARMAQDSGTISGRLKEVTPGTVTIAGRDGNERTLRVDPQLTTVTIDGKAAAVGDLEPGQDVRASFSEEADGRRVATRIWTGATSADEDRR